MNKNTAKKKKPGPTSRVTRDLVKRVSKLVAKGIPISLALASQSQSRFQSQSQGENGGRSKPVTQAAYERHLRRHPELAAIQGVAKLKFLEHAFDVIYSRPSPYMRWLLERRHSDIFGPNQNQKAEEIENANENDDLRVSPQSTVRSPESTVGAGQGIGAAVGQSCCSAQTCPSRPFGSATRTALREAIPNNP